MESIGTSFSQQVPAHFESPKKEVPDLSPSVGDVIDLQHSGTQEVLHAKAQRTEKTTPGTENSASPRGVDPAELEFVNGVLNSQGKTYPDVDKAIKQNLNKIQIMDQGVVSKVYPEDTHGLKHQLFDLKFSSGTVVRVAHNIDVAGRIPDLKPGLELAVKGEFINKNNMVRVLSEILAGDFNLDLFSYNLFGSIPGTDGLVHWTHRSNSSNHEHGGFVIVTKGNNYHKVIQ